MNIAFRLMIWYLLFNICTGLFLELMPEFEEEGQTSGLFYDEEDGVVFIEDLNKTVSPDKSLTDESSTLDAAMNYIQLGFIWRWIEVVNNVMFGSIEVLSRLTGKFFGGNTDGMDTLFTFLKWVITLGYGLAAFALWTEKEL